MIVPGFMAVTVPSSPENNIHIPVDNLIGKIVIGKSYTDGGRIIYGFPINNWNVVVTVVIAVAVVIIAILIIVT
jgi:hypothetical protein